MIFKTIMTAVCQQLDLSVSDVNDDTVILTIEFNHDICIEVTWVESTSAICLSAILAYLPDDSTAHTSLFETLLRSQRYGVLTHNTYFTLDKEEHTLLLAQNIPTENTASSHITQQLNQFVKTLQLWRQKYQHNHLSLDAEVTPAPAPAELLMGNAIIYG